MTQPLKMPDELRRAIATDLRPVRPLPPPARRAVAVALWIPVAIGLVLALLGLRPDMPSLGVSMTVIQLAIEAALGLALVTLALAESIPGRGPARSRALAAIATAVVVVVVQAAVTRGASPGISVPNPLTSHGPACFALQVLVGIPALAIVAVLVVRAAPLRAAMAGVLGGAGVGLVADGIYRLHCPITDLRHVLVWHGAAAVLLALAGLVGGLTWGRAQRIRMRTRSDARRRST
jgi:hypothetical protein